ncbi:hypothetical protein HAX54_012245 [Datura stramonium]|uniref:Amidase domain-containing protein n=1 Tax=Datura stramonium TaxID=4076 RepID=A0ABS8Y365_DATST|nr:hypothetical protein [Datura stramonium]
MLDNFVFTSFELLLLILYVDESLLGSSLLDKEGGATCTGRTVVADMAFGISGEQRHFDTPTNPAAPARMPGGSSSGATVAVAANFVDFSWVLMLLEPVLTRLDGLQEIPAYCAVSGMFWLQVPFAAQRNPRTIVIADDCFQSLNFPGDRNSQAVTKAVENLFGRQTSRHENLKPI